MSNFNFLKRVNENLFVIAYEAEKLFRDEYFEQCIAQTRRLAENLCRDVMGDMAKPTDSFDTMLATLKDTPAQNDFEKEFIEDLYFLKKEGNASVHSLQVKQDGNAALNCLQSAFEASLNYAVFKKGLDSKYLQQQFDEELLATGKKSKKSKIEEKYNTEKEKVSKRKNIKQSKPKTKTTKTTKKVGKKKKEDNFDYQDNASFDNDKKPLWKEVLETIAAGLVIALVYFLIFSK